MMAYSAAHLARISKGLCINCEAPSNGKKRCGKCQSRCKENRQKWVKKNPEKARATLMAWRAANTEKVHAIELRYRQSATPEQKAKKAKYMIDWRAKNTAKRKESGHIWRVEHREAVNTYLRQWLARNPEKTREYHQRQWDKNPDANKMRLRERYHADIHAARLKDLNHKIRRRSCAGSHTVKQWLARVAYYNWCCRWCGKHLTDKTITKDHVIALAVGGTNFASNLVPACKSCNSRKQTQRSYSPHRHKK